MDPNTLVQETVSECDAHYTAKTGKSMASVGLDPISIITAIIAIFSQICQKPAPALKAAAAAREPGTLLTARSATRQALREQHPNDFLPYRKFNGDAIADAVLASVAGKDEAKIQAGLDCCGV